jgi:hypothetical protein
MSNVFTITITAIDKATAVMRGINQSVAKMTAPVTRLKDSIRSFEREAGLDKVGAGFKKIGGFAKDAFGALGRFGGGLAAVTSIGSIAGVAALVSSWSKLGFGIDVAAKRIGVSTDFLQQNRIALAKYGADAATADASLQGLNDTFENAKFGRAPGALGVMRQIGIDYNVTDPRKQMLEVAAALQKYANDPIKQRVILEQLHIGGPLADELIAGPKALEKAWDDAARSGAVMTAAQIASAKAAKGAVDRLIVDWMALQNGILGSGQALAAFNAISLALNPSDKEAQKFAAVHKRNLAAFLIDWAAIGILGPEALPILKTINQGAEALVNGLAGAAESGWGAVVSFFSNIWKQIVAVFHAGADLVLGELARIPGFSAIVVATKIVDAVVHGGKAAAQAVESTAGEAAKAGADWTARAGHDVAAAFAVKRNNPGNIRPPDGRGFLTFPTLTAGIVGLARQLQIYQDRHRLNTVAGIVTRYEGGPANTDHNDIAGYIRHVSTWTGFDPNRKLDLHDPKTLATLEAAMIRQEQGRAVLNVGDVLAAIGGSTAEAATPAPAAAAAQGHVQVDVRVRHDGHSATARTRTSGGVGATARVETSLHHVPA